MNSHWTEVWYDDDWNECQIMHYEIGDTVTVEGVIYHKLFRNDELFAGLRESEDGKLFALFYCVYDFCTDGENQIYDFNWKPGDTIYFYNNGGDDSLEYQITSNDSILLLDGNYYNRIYLNDKMIIQGIGTTSGFFYPFWSYSCILNYETLCFYRDDQLIYSNPKYNSCDNCDSLHLGASKMQTHDIKQYISGDKLYLDYSSINEKVESVSIYTIAGQQIRYNKGNTANSIIIPGLEKGIYIYKIVCKGHQQYIGKIYKP